MASPSRDSEKAAELDGGTLGAESGDGHLTDYERDIEKGRDTDDDAVSQLVAEGAVGEPDSDHEEIEGMDEGHLDDLVRQHVCPTLYLPRLVIVLT